MAIDLTGCEVLLLDSCSLLNLYATGRLQEVLATCGVRCAIADAVARESVYVLKGGEGEAAAERELVDLGPLIVRGDLEVWSPESEAEYASVVNFAQELDDGESMTCALAFHRRGAVVTDDRKALRVLQGRAPQVKVLATSQVLKLWSDSRQLDRSILRDAMLDVQRRGRFTPGRQDPLIAWWESIIGHEG